MLTLRKLASLSEGSRRRKTVVLLRDFEHDIVAGKAIDTDYLLGLWRQIFLDEFWPEEIRSTARKLILGANLPPSAFQVNALRHALLSALGKDWADWNNHVASPLGNLTPKEQSRPMRVYLDGLRSPFNVGSVARTSLAFGMERLWCSPDCASPEHQRARRSAMGALESLSWDVADLECLDRRVTGALFALELGGVNLCDFEFPNSGTVILGSEELGISSHVLRLAKNDGGVVSIPLPGRKTSLNVGVAFGILTQKWVGAVCGI